MALLAVQEGGALSVAGAILTEAAAAGGGDTFPNDENTYFVVNNGSGSSVNVTFTATGACSHGVLHDLVVAVGAGVRKSIGPFSRSRFGEVIAVAYSLATSVTVAARRR